MTARCPTAAAARALVAALAVSGCAHRPVGPPPDGVVMFDAGAVRALVQWARSEDRAVPDDWRAKPPFALTRLWARWARQSDPSRDVEAALAQIAKAKQTTEPRERLRRTSAFIESILDGHERRLGPLLEHVRGFLPKGAVVRARVYFSAFAPPEAFAWDGEVVLSATAPTLGEDRDKVFNALARELFRDACGAYQPRRFIDQATQKQQLVDYLLWQVQTEGLSTYVGYRAGPLGLEVEDYQLLDEPAQLVARFDLVHRLLEDIVTMGPFDAERMRRRLWNEASQVRSVAVVGAEMARRIDQRLGRKALIDTVAAGPRAFALAYAKTEPDASRRFEPP